MSLWTDQVPPVLYPNAVATEAGWADPVTGELYVAVTGLSTFKGGAAELVTVGIYNNKSQFTTSQSLGNAEVYPAGAYMVLEAVFSEAVTWSGGPPTITGNINGNARTFTYFQDTTDLLSDTVGKVTSITISNAGQHFQVGDKLVFTGGGGSSAAGYVSSVGGSNAITGIVLTNNGASYASAPTVTVSTGHVVSVTVGGSGTGYLNGDTLVFSGGGGTGAAGYIVVDSTGNVSRTVITNQGSGYTSAPTATTATLHGSGNTFTPVASYGASSGYALTAVIGTPANGKGTNRILFRYQIASNETATASQITFTSPIGGGATWTDVDSAEGSGATATATMVHGVTSYTVTVPGSGYTTAPVVTVSGDGTGATAVAVLDKAVNTVTPVIAGVGYRSAPSVTQSGGGSTNATITPVLATAGIVCDVTVGGSKITNYTNGTAVTVDNTGTNGTGFAATLLVNGSGVITGVTITAVGSGYTSAPALTATLGTGQTLTAVLGFGIASYTVGGTNTGYTAAPGLTIGIPTATAVGTSLGAGVVVKTTATATATVHNLQTVKSVSVVTPGSGYTAATVAFGGPGTLAAATAAVSGEVSKITVTAPGSEYWLAPTVVITPHSGDTTGENAAATAVVDRGRVVSVVMTDNGDSYTLAPDISFTPTTETPTLTFDTTQFVSGVTVSGTGTGYVTGTALVFSSGVAAGTIRVDDTGNIIGVVLTNAGSYASAPTITVTAPPAWSSSASNYAVGQVVLYSGVRYKAKIGGVTNFNRQPDISGTYWLALTDNTLTAVMGSGIVGTSTVDGVAPTISSADITHDRFGDVITQTAFVTGDFFTLTLNTSKPVFVVGGSGATVALTITSGSKNATYFSGSGTNKLHFAYQVASGDSSAASTFSTAAIAVLAGGTTIKDAAGNNLVLTFSAPTTTAVSFN